MTAVEGAGNQTGIVITKEFKLVRASTGPNSAQSVTGPSVESVLTQLAPDAPVDYLLHAAQIIEGILGIGGPS